MCTGTYNLTPTDWINITNLVRKKKKSSRPPWKDYCHLGDVVAKIYTHKNLRQNRPKARQIEWQSHWWTDKQEKLVRQARWELGHMQCIWQADRQSAWYACISLLFFSEGHPPWCTSGFGTVDSINSSGAVLVSTRLAQLGVRRSWWLVSKHTNRNLLTQRGRRQERIFVSGLQKCHTSTESMFKEERRTSLFIFHSIYTHALSRLYDAVLMTSFFLFFTDNHNNQQKFKTNVKINSFYISLFYWQNMQQTFDQKLCPLRAELQNQTLKDLACYIFKILQLHIVHLESSRLPSTAKISTLRRKTIMLLLFYLKLQEKNIPYTPLILCCACFIFFGVLSYGTQDRWTAWQK